MFRSRPFLPLLLVLSCLAVSAEHPTAGADPGDPGLMAIMASAQASQADLKETDRILEGFGSPPARSAAESLHIQDSSDSPSAVDTLLEGFSSTSEATDKAGPETFRADSVSEPARNASPDDAGPVLPPWLELTGQASLRSVANLDADPPAPGKADRRGLSSLMGEISLQADIDLPAGWEARVSGDAFYDLAYQLKGRDDFSRQELDSLEQSAELDEAWLRGSLAPSLDLKTGRQIVVWGRSDNLRVTDVLNPMDFREPGMTDIEDLRLPVAMTRLDYYMGSLNLSGVVIHEIRFNKEPPFGGEFFGAPNPPPPEDKPESGLDHQEIALALNGDFPGWDFSLYTASVFSDQGHFTRTPQGPRREHERLAMLGLAGNAVLGNWLFKFEAAGFHGLEFMSRPEKDYTRLDILAGVEYSGFHETSISLEIANRHLFDFDQALEASPEAPEEDDFQWAFRYTRDFMHDLLTLTVLATLNGLDLSGGGFQRLELDYELTSHLNLIGGLVLYQYGDRRPFDAAGDKDRVFLKLEYNF